MESLVCPLVEESLGEPGLSLDKARGSGMTQDRFYFLGRCTPLGSRTAVFLISGTRPRVSEPVSHPLALKGPATYGS